MTLTKRISFSALLLAAAPVYAGDLEQALLRCSVLGDVSARLGCFDAIAKDAVAPVADVAPPGPKAAVVAAISPTAAPQTAVEKTVEIANKPPETPISTVFSTAVCGATVGLIAAATAALGPGGATSATGATASLAMASKQPRRALTSPSTEQRNSACSRSPA